MRLLQAIGQIHWVELVSLLVGLIYLSFILLGGYWQLNGFPFIDVDLINAVIVRRDVHVIINRWVCLVSVSTVVIILNVLIYQCGRALVVQ
jgi:hypothetical protein